jgi:hypothetical protein
MDGDGDLDGETAGGGIEDVGAGRPSGGGKSHNAKKLLDSHRNDRAPFPAV